MLTAQVKIRNQWNREEVSTGSVDFATIGELEDYLAYNRAYILSLSFTGKLTREEDSE